MASVVRGSIGAGVSKSKGSYNILGPLSIHCIKLVAYVLKPFVPSKNALAIPCAIQSNIPGNNGFADV